MNWLNKLKEYAPDIAGAILTGGATLPALAMKAISDATGMDIKNEAELGKAIEVASPDMLFKLKQANSSFTIRMKELSNDLTATELADVQSARDSHKHSYMPSIICIALTLMVSVMGWFIFDTPIPEQNKEIAYMLFGALLAKWGDSIAYWVGTTRSSAEKDRKKP